MAFFDPNTQNINAFLQGNTGNVGPNYYSGPTSLRNYGGRPSFGNPPPQVGNPAPVGNPTPVGNPPVNNPPVNNPPVNNPPPQIATYANLPPVNSPPQVSYTTELAEQALSGEGVPWGELYQDLQTEYWNRALRDPNTGNIANVQVRDRLSATPYQLVDANGAAPGHPDYMGGVEQAPAGPNQRYVYDSLGGGDGSYGDPITTGLNLVEYGDWRNIPVTDYIRDMEKYAEYGYTAPTSGDDYYGPQQRIRSVNSQGPLADYYNTLLDGVPRGNGFNYSFKQGLEPDKYGNLTDDGWAGFGDNFLNHLKGKGVDTESTRTWAKNQTGTDYDSVASNYLDNYLNQWTYNGGIKDEPGYSKFGTGAEKLRWFADDSNLNFDLLKGDLRTPTQPSAFGTVRNVLAPYASGTGRSFNLDTRHTLGEASKQTPGSNTPGNVRYDAAFDKWENTGEGFRKVQAKAQRAQNTASVISALSIFIPVLGPAIGAAVGGAATFGSVAAANAVGAGIAGAVLGGIGGSATGQGFGKGFIRGGLTSGLGSYAGSLFSGTEGAAGAFNAADASQLAAQGLSPSAISQVLQGGGLAQGSAALYGQLANAGLTNPAFASVASGLVKNGIGSLTSGKKFNPLSALAGGVGSYAGSAIGNYVGGPAGGALGGLTSNLISQWGRGGQINPSSLGFSAFRGGLSGASRQ